MFRKLKGLARLARGAMIIVVFELVVHVILPVLGFMAWSTFAA